jgi:hypothetical protein
MTQLDRAKEEAKGIFSTRKDEGNKFLHRDDAFAAAEWLMKEAVILNVALPVESGLRYVHRLAEYIPTVKHLVSFGDFYQLLSEHREGGEGYHERQGSVVKIKVRMEEYAASHWKL